MKREVLAISVLLISSTCLFTQEPSDVHQQTTAPPNARFEVVQSELAARWTFRLDRFTGHVAQLVETEDAGDAWEEMTVIGLPPLDMPTRARFQIFTSGLAAKHTFLIDNDTGRTWVVVSSTGKNADGTDYKIDLWEPFEGQH